MVEVVVIVEDPVVRGIGLGESLLGFVTVVGAGGPVLLGRCKGD